MRITRFLTTKIAALIGLCTFMACAALSAAPNTLDLSGTWNCVLDPNGVGESAGWYKSIPAAKASSVTLPGTLDESNVGFPNGDKTDQHLYKALAYEGAAWFFHTVTIPQEWAGQSLFLTLERSKVTKVWINGQYVGSNDLVYAKQVFDVTKFLTPGKDNFVAISVNNDIRLVPVMGSHAYSPDTQSNWNGIIGRFAFEARNPMHISSLRVTSDVGQKTFLVDVSFTQKTEAAKKMVLLVSGTRKGADGRLITKTSTIVLGNHAAGESIHAYLELGEDAALWSDDNPNVYDLGVYLENADSGVVDSRFLQTGLREFKGTPDGFTINGHKTFLRGKHDACVFPLTAHPPMDVAGWERVFRIAKSYGINHYRFHTFTPPEAAYVAADKVGIYIQCELPIWWAIDFNDPAQFAYMERLGKEILDNYADHPSFVMMALGNEISKDRSPMKTIVDYFRAYDPRPLYAQGSNNRNWDPFYAEGDDFWASFRTGPYQADSSTDARLSMSFLDSQGEGGMLNIRRPNTTINFDKALERTPVPFSGYEVGQYQVFPNFSEIRKYTGILKPLNLELYRDRLEKAGMLDQAEDFFRASGALSVICYRADIEAMLRTKRFAAFNLLDLQDYPGQGTALVGMLDAFMDSKGLITPEAWRNFCSEEVILLEQPKYSWTDEETYKAEVEFSNYSRNAYPNGVIRWTLRSNGKTLKSGSVAIAASAYSGLVKANSSIEIPLPSVAKKVPAQMEMVLELEGTKVTTSYPIWVFPASDKVEIPSRVTVAGKLDAATVAILEKGGSVILFPKAEAIAAHSVPMQFISEFWNWQMFTGFAEKNKGHKSPGTLGILLDPKSKAFAKFPTSFHTDYQWWPMVTNVEANRALILDDMAGYKPLVQVVDNIARDHRLGLVSEFKVGKGRLIVCGSPLPELAVKYPEARQFYRSLLSYAASKSFKPKKEVSVEKLHGLGL